MVPVIPLAGGAVPTVALSPHDGPPSWFIELAQKAGARVIYHHVQRFDADEVTEEAFQDRVGQICRLEMAFTADSVLHRWIARTTWYARLPQRRSDGQADSVEEVDPEQVEQLAVGLVANRAFREAAATKDARRTVAYADPEVVGLLRVDAGRKLVYRALELAGAQVERMRRDRYGELELRLGELAEEFSRTQDFMDCTDNAERRRAAREFLVHEADGLQMPANSTLLDRFFRLPPLARR
jgi:hypothetical protein